MMNGDLDDPTEHHTIFHFFLVTMYQWLHVVVDGHIFTISCAEDLLKVPCKVTSQPTFVV